MKFEEALSATRSDERVRRELWNNGWFLVIDAETLWLRDPQGRQWPWLNAPRDVLREDWEVVPREETVAKGVLAP